MGKKVINILRSKSFLYFGHFSHPKCDNDCLKKVLRTMLILVENTHNMLWVIVEIPGGVAQSVKCLATDASLTADSGVASSIPARSHTFVEIDHEIITTVILLPSAESFKKGCCQLQAKVCARSTG